MYLDGDDDVSIGSILCQRKEPLDCQVLLGIPVVGATAQVTGHDRGLSRLGKLGSQVDSVA